MTTGAVRIWLPTHLRRLCGVTAAVVHVAVARPSGPMTLGDALDALEHAYPALRGTIRDYPAPGALRGGALRPYIRCYAGEVDLTPAGVCATLPQAVADGTEVLRIVGAIAGGERQTPPDRRGAPRRTRDAVSASAACSGRAVRSGVGASGDTRGTAPGRAPA